MKYFYEAVADCFYDGEEKFPCFYKEKLEKKDVIVIEMNGNFITATVVKETDELTVLVKRVEVKEVITKVDTKPYLAKKENMTKKLILLQEMEEKCKEVKMMETLKKYSDRDEDMKAMYESFEQLGK